MTGGQDSKSKLRKLVFGRYMLPDTSEFACQILNLTADGAVFVAENVPNPGQPIVAYIEIIGRVEAVTGKPVENGFEVAFSLSAQRRSRLEGKLRQAEQRVENVDEIPPPKSEKRAPGGSLLTISDGREYPCEVLDISTAGADIKIDVLPSIGSKVMLGKMKGRVSRHIETGVSVEFV